MAAPRGEYTPQSGPLAGRTFTLRPGESSTSTAPYSRYQQERSRALGFTGYTQERRIISAPDFRTLENRLVHANDMNRNAARSYLAAQDFATMTRGEGTGRKKSAITFAMYEGLYDDGDEASDEIEY